MQMNTKLLPLTLAGSTFLLGAAALVLFRNPTSENGRYVPGEVSSAAEMIDGARADAEAAEGRAVTVAEQDEGASTSPAVEMDASVFEMIKRGQQALASEKPDYRGAARWFEKAGLTGDRKAMELAAGLFEEAPAPVGNRVRAYAWWTLAQAFGGENVERRRLLLADLMTEAELKSGQRMATQNLNLIRKTVAKAGEKK